MSFLEHILAFGIKMKDFEEGIDEEELLLLCASVESLPDSDDEGWFQSSPFAAIQRLEIHTT